MSNGKGIKALPIRELTLDRRNPRHGSKGAFQDEGEAIEYLVAYEKIYELAKSMSSNGVQGIDLIAVIQESKGKYIVLEGNRRICALKILHNPQLVKDGAQRRLYEGLANSMTSIPSEIDCRVYGSREECKPWMLIKHASGQPSGTKPWKPREKWFYDPKSSDQLANQILEYGARNELLPAEKIGEISLTTLSRYLSMPVIREAMGIESNSDLDVYWEESVFKRIVSMFLLDAFNKEKITSRKSKEEREAYAKEIAHITKNRKKRVMALDLVPVGSARMKPSPATKPARAKNILIRNTLISNTWEGLSYLSETPLDRKIGKIIDELREVKYKKFPFSAGCLLRMLLELVTKRFLEKERYTVGRKNMAVLQKVVIKKLEGKIPELKIRVLRQAILDKDHYLSYSTQSLWVHGHLIPTSGDLDSTCTNFDELIVELLKLGK